MDVGNVIFCAPLKTINGSNGSIQKSFGSIEFVAKYSDRKRRSFCWNISASRSRIDKCPFEEYFRRFLCTIKKLEDFLVSIMNMFDSFDKKKVVGHSKANSQSNSQPNTPTMKKSENTLGIQSDKSRGASAERTPRPDGKCPLRPNGLYDGTNSGSDDIEIPPQPI